MRCNLNRWIITLVAASTLGFFASAARADDSYYMLIFAYQGRPNLPRFAHSFAAFVKTSEVKDVGLDASRIEIHTISWLPATLSVEPLRLRPVAGRNLDLLETLQLAASQNADISAWGPYRIQKDLYDRAVAQIDRLSRGEIAFKAMDRGFRPTTASNCFHAISDILDGPLLDTGTAYGNPASEMVRDHLSGQIIQPNSTYRFLIKPMGLEKYPITYRD
jgi:hypothetical protein